MKPLAKMLILGLVLALPATAFAQRGRGTRPGVETRGNARGAANREVLRGGIAVVGPFAYQPVPLFSPYFETTVGTIPTYPLPSAFGVYAPPPIVEPSTPPAPVPVPTPDYVQALTSQVQELSSEVLRLRTEQAQQTRAALEPVSVLPGTILVFRDNHRMEIHSYAIIQQTLSVLDKDNSTHIALADLDLDATKKVNLENGIRFFVPSAQ